VAIKPEDKAFDFKFSNLQKLLLPSSPVGFRDLAGYRSYFFQ